MRMERIGSGHSSGAPRADTAVSAATAFLDRERLQRRETEPKARTRQGSGLWRVWGHGHGWSSGLKHKGQTSNAGGRLL
jgi:hypothetical protein